MDFPKTKNQLAEELGISLSTLQRWIKKKGLTVPRGLISPEKQIEIFNSLGYKDKSILHHPPNRTDNNNEGTK